MTVVITAKELQTRKSNGSVYLCISCKDVSNKIVMTNYTPKGPRGVYYNFCEVCIKSMEECRTCQNSE